MDLGNSEHMLGAELVRRGHRETGALSKPLSKTMRYALVQPMRRQRARAARWRDWLDLIALAGYIIGGPI